jgi:hypothetical protein
MRKIFVNHLSDRRLISRIYKRTPKIPQQKSKQPNTKMGKGVEQIFLKEEYKWLISP